MPLNSYQKMCYRWFGQTAENIASDRMRLSLERAHIDMRASAYLACVWVNTMLAALISTVLLLSLILFLSLDFIFIMLLAIMPVIVTVITYFIFMNLPSSKAKSRGKQIDLHLPYALNFISAMSSAGITPTEIFKSLSKQKIYGELREEALWIYRDVSLLGRDIISAIKANIQRTPSEKFKEFLQGAVVTVQSGGALKPYFMSKADQYMRENRIAQKQTIESLGVMAEAYVTAAVAGVLLVIIIIPLLSVISQTGGAIGSSSSGGDLGFMNIFAFVLIPSVHLAFTYVLSSMTQRV